MKKIDSKDFKYLVESGHESDFSDNEIDGDINLILSNNRNIILNNSLINGEFRLDASEYLNIKANGASFMGEVEFKLLRGRVDMKGATFTAGLNITALEQFILDLSETKLAGKVYISDLKFASIDLSGIEFVSKTENDKFIFKHNEVLGEANVSKSIFHNAVFSNTKFKNTVTFDNTIFGYSVIPGSGNFFDCTFEKDSYWNNVDFGKGCFFNGSIFKGSTIFFGVNKDASCIGDYSGVTFHKRVVFDNSQFSKISFHNCEFADMASFKGVKSGHLEISKAVFMRGSDFLNARIGNADKETFRIIKNEFLKINNQIEALHYRSKEMTAYEKELKLKRFSGEHILLWLNRVSNEYGLNWLRGVRFTVCIGLIFYVLYLFIGLGKLPFNWGWVSLESFLQATGNTIKYFIRFFIPTHDLDFMNKFAPNAAGFFIDFLGRIFIGYGIYQTIQAFRKFGKN